jgi:hypothetical protein
MTGRWRIRPGVFCRDVCALAEFTRQQVARAPHARPDPKGRIHRDKRRRDVCATYPSEAWQATRRLWYPPRIDGQAVCA